MNSKPDVNSRNCDDKERSGLSGKAARVIAAQLYVAKGLQKATKEKRKPTEIIRFILDNPDYFPTFGPTEIKNLKDKTKNLEIGLIPSLNYLYLLYLLYILYISLIFGSKNDGKMMVKRGY